ncbi:trypsin alpha-like [Condylostylus longicornis]|uniref:trypsin alpha-like n=1 Tax=Condylostylus longicornis TaxID=2530218 RepID=UPI00244DDA11|nr:trypsin alpha-like [Condylostylus longicornis]
MELKICKVLIFILAINYAIGKEFEFDNSITIQNNNNNNRVKRVVNGRRSKEAHHPYQVAIFVDGDVFLCSGVIIKSNWILTAAHCVYEEDITTMVIRAGSNHRSKGGVISLIDDAYYHEEYDPDTYDYDIALLRSTVDFSKYFNSKIYHIKPIEIANKSPLTYGYGIVSGWGRTKEGKEGGVQKLKYALLKIFPQNLCKKLNDGITNRMFCAGDLDGKTDACQGDSGGPLVSYGQLIGIVSWGEGCARENLPSVYTNLYKLRDWIDYIFEEYDDDYPVNNKNNNNFNRDIENKRTKTTSENEIDDLNSISNNNEFESEVNESEIEDLIKNKISTSRKINNDDENETNDVEKLRMLKTLLDFLF